MENIKLLFKWEENSFNRREVISNFSKKTGYFHNIFCMTMYSSINTSILPSLTHGTDRTLSSSHVNHIKADVMVIIKNLNPNESHL